MRDWLLIVGGLLILGVLAHGLWIAWRSKRGDLRIRYDKNIPDLDLDDIDLLRAELPSGPARVVDGAETAADAPKKEKRMARPSAAAQRPRPATAARGKAEPRREPEVPLDPIDQDLARETQGEQQEEDAPEIAVTPPRRERAARTTTDDPAPEPRPAVPEQTPLFAGDPIVSRDRGTARGGRWRNGTEPRRPKRAEPDPVAEEPAEEDFEDVLVINVLRRDGEQMPGPDVLEVVTEHGLRYGDMNIFHRYGAGQRIEFSMANAVKPGTFDLGAIDELYTPGVSFFLRLPGPDQPLEAFDDMAKVARDMAKRLHADLKDERHSVMTAQTLEHCRQRIREFRRRQMSRRS